MSDFFVKIDDSFELLSQDEWDTYLGTGIFNNIRINIDKFAYLKENIFLYPILDEIIKGHNNKVGSIIITYALCKHYYDKGIPDDPWYISPGTDGQSIQYMPNFSEEHWMRRYWYNYFSESIYFKFFSIWDNVMELLDIFYNLKTPHNGGFKYNVIKRLKQNKPNIANFLKKDVLKNKIFVTANKYRNKYAHGTSPNEITDCNKLTEDTLVDIPIKDDQGKYIIDSNGKLTTKKVKATTFSYGVGEYTLVKDIMKNIDDFAIFTGNKIITLLDLMIEE